MHRFRESEQRGYDTAGLCASANIVYSGKCGAGGSQRLLFRENFHVTAYKRKCGRAGS